MDSINLEDGKLFLQNELVSKYEIASSFDDALNRKKLARKDACFDDTDTTLYYIDQTHKLGRPITNFDLVVQTNEKDDIDCQSDAILRDEIVKLMDYLCESVENNIMQSLLHPSIGESVLCSGDIHTNAKDQIQPAEQSNVSKILIDGSSKVTLEVSQIECEDMASKWKSEKFSLENDITIKKSALKIYESNSTSLETSIEKLHRKLSKSNEMLSAKCFEVKSLKSLLENKEYELKDFKVDISHSLKQISKLKQRLDDQKFETELVRKEKDKALDEIARLHEELDNQLAKCKDLEMQCVLKANELEKLRYAAMEENEEVSSKKCKMVSRINKENVLSSVGCSGLNIVPQMSVTGPFYNCDVSSESLKNVFPSHHKNFNFYNQSNIKIGQQTQKENEDIDKENKKSNIQDSVQKNGPFLRVGLSRKSRIRRPLHDSNN